MPSDRFTAVIGFSIRVAILVHPLQRVLDPVEVAVARVVEHAQADEVDARRDAVVDGAGAVGADDAGDVRAVRALGAVVVRIGVVFSVKSQPPTTR